MTSRILVAVYSWSGATAQVAQKLTTDLNATVCQLDVADGTFTGDMYAVDAQAKRQKRTGQLPVLTKVPVNLADYGLICVGGPVWSGTVATPLLSFLKQLPDAAVLAPFYTHQGDPGDYEHDFASAASSRKVTAPLAVARGAVSQSDAQIADWAKVIRQDMA